MGQWGTLYNDKKINPPGRRNNSKSVCTKYKSLKIYKPKTALKGEIDKTTMTAGDFNTPHPKWKLNVLWTDISQMYTGQSTYEEITQIS